MKKIILPLMALLCGISCADNRPERDVTVAVVADLHFDLPPETDQYYHVRALNRLEGQFRVDPAKTGGIDMGVVEHLDGVAVAGDMFDKALPVVHDMYFSRYTRGEGDKQIHYDVYPGYGNHDIDPFSQDSVRNIEGRMLNLRLLDSLLQQKLSEGKILNLHPESRSYSWNVGDVHFIQAHRYSGDTGYCESNMKWLAEDLAKYASEGNPVVYIQHYGFDEWALGWWTEEEREALFDVLDRYNLAAFLVGHTHEPSIQKYRSHKIYQVNNAWPDEDGKGSFAVVRLKGDNIVIATCRWTDGEGNYEVVGPYYSKSLKR